MSSVKEGSLHILRSTKIRRAKTLAGEEGSISSMQDFNRRKSDSSPIQHQLKVAAVGANEKR